MCICTQLLWLEHRVDANNDEELMQYCFFFPFMCLCYCFPFFFQCCKLLCVCVPFAIGTSKEIEKSEKMQVFMPFHDFLRLPLYLQHLWQNACTASLFSVSFGITFHLKNRSKRVCECVSAPNIIYSQQYNRAIALIFPWWWWWRCSVSLLFCWAQAKSSQAGRQASI